MAWRGLGLLKRSFHSLAYTTYGDLIAIDPTFYSMARYWNIISLKVIGPERNIKNGSVVFSCNKSEEGFLWILKLFLYELLSKDITTTICSDDNLVLNAAFRIKLSDTVFQTKTISF